MVLASNVGFVNKIYDSVRRPIYFSYVKFASVKVDSGCLEDLDSRLHIEVSEASFKIDF